MGDNIFINIVWKGDPYRPYLRYSRKGDDTHQDLLLEAGKTINFKIGDSSYCIGSDYDKGSWLTCVANQKRRYLIKQNNGPVSQFSDLGSSWKKGSQSTEDLPTFTEREPLDNSLQCSACKRSEYFTCRRMCQGDICTPTSDKAKKLCDPPNTSVYLTSVGGKLKVGVSLGIPRRWVEQGSDLATVVAKAPGLEAREIEHRAARELGLALQVRNSTKLKNLNKNHLIPKKKMEKKIEGIKPIIREVLNSVEGEMINNPEIIDLRDHYGQTNFSNPVRTVEVSPEQEFGGEIVGVKGSLLIIKQGFYYHAMNLKRIRGRDFKFIDQEAKIETQSYLNEFF